MCCAPQSSIGSFSARGEALLRCKGGVVVTLAKLPEEERPRERLFACGVKSLSLIELLALCLGSSGQRGASALDLAAELLAVFGNLDQMLQATLEELLTVKGVGRAKAGHIQALGGLVGKMVRTVGRPQYQVESPADVYTLVHCYFRHERREVALLIFRDARGRVFSDEILAVGSLSEVIVHPRELFHRAVCRCAASVILVHNHPSGELAPSIQDVKLTKLLASSGEILGIPLDDHLVVNRVGYRSFWEKGLLKPRATY